MSVGTYIASFNDRLSFPTALIPTPRFMFALISPQIHISLPGGLGKNLCYGVKIRSHKISQHRTLPPSNFC